MTVAYWISPKGEIIDVKTKHINEVISNPEKFGFTEGFIEYVYNFYKEKLGQEGKAREQILLALLKQGWIRIRRYKTFWSVNIKVMAGKAKIYITKWAQKILKGLFGYREDDPFVPVKIDQAKQMIKTIELKKMAESDKFIPESVLVETTVENLPTIKPYDIVYEVLHMNRSFREYIDGN